MVAYMNTDRNTNRRAFTVAEMIVTLTLVTIMSAVMLTRVDYTSFRVDAGARGVRAMLQRAQANAVTSQHNMLVAVDVANGQLFVVDDVNNNLVVDADERVTSVPLQDGVIFATPPDTWAGAPAPASAMTGSVLITVTVNGNALPAFVFRSDGAASSDVQVYLTSKRGLTTDIRGVNVTQATGRVDWYKHLSGSWMLAGF
jgi:hypothetical protein